MCRCMCSPAIAGISQYPASYGFYLSLDFTKMQFFVFSYKYA